MSILLSIKTESPLCPQMPHRTRNGRGYNPIGVHLYVEAEERTRFDLRAVDVQREFHLLLVLRNDLRLAASGVC